METNQNTGFGSGVAGASPQEQFSGETWEEQSGTGKQTVRQKTRETTAHLKQGARDATRNLKQKGSETAHQLQDQSKEFMQTRKAELAGRISGCGAAVRRAADKLRDEQDPNIASYADMVADRFQQAGDYIQSRDISSIYHDVEDMARRRPEILFGGMFVVGLALSRFLKASNERPYYESEFDTEEDYWVEDYDAASDSDVMSGQSSDMSLTGPVTPGPVSPPLGTPGSGMGPSQNPGPII